MLRPQRRARLSRVARPEALDHVLKITNGEVRRPERYEPELSQVKAVIDRVIRHCDSIEDALAGFESFAGGTILISKNKDRVNRAIEIAAALAGIFLRSGLQRTFSVTLSPVSATEKDVEGSWKAGVLPPAEELFGLNGISVWPIGNVSEQLVWEFYQGITQLDDLRRLRRCDGYLHAVKFHFIGKKVQRREHYFCSDECRSDFNYKKLIETLKGGGRARLNSKANHANG